MKLTVIICTFCREVALQKTLCLLFGAHVNSVALLDLDVIVVDQGRTLRRENYPTDWRLRIVSQGNFGGAGGFTRGLIEAMDAGGEWVLLMDDDATPDEASFAVLSDYVASRNPDTRFALHGTMFSEEEPDIIYEAGAHLKQPEEGRFDIVRRLAGHKPCMPLENDPRLSEHMDIDYGAWWFFCIHTDSVREVGLPLPLFIRGDDREYGLRLKEQGILTIPLPGLRVWHPAHGEKLSRWYMYFDWRNNFITKSIHRKADRIGLTREFFRKAFFRLLGGQYDIVAYMISGLESYLNGPNELGRDPQCLIADAREIEGLYTSTYSYVPDACCRVDKVERFRRWREIVQTFSLNGYWFPAWRCSEGSKLPVFDYNDFDWLCTFRLPCYGVVSRSEGRVKVYTRSGGVFFKQLVRLISVTVRYYLLYKKMRATWRSSVGYYTRREFWDNYVRQ